MNTVLLLVVAGLVVLFFVKDSEGESLLVKLLRMVKLVPEKPEPEEKQVFDGYIDLAYDNLKDDPVKAKEYAVKAVDESLKYIVKDDEVIKPKKLTAADWVKSPVVAVAIIFAALLLLSQCNLKPIKFTVPNVDTFKQIVVEE